MTAASKKTPLSGYAGAALDYAKFIHEKCRDEIDAGRFVWQGRSVCPQEGDGVSVKVAADRDLRSVVAKAEANLVGLLDQILSEEKGFGSSFSELLLEGQRENGSVLTVPAGCSPSLTVLADAYDYAAERRGLPLRACRGATFG